jgi:hypothetical protein
MLTIASLVSATPPLFRITASSHYDAGLQHGTLAKTRIQGWLQSDEMLGLVNFSSAGPGQDALQAMKRDNTRTYPHLAREIAGIAAGAAVPEDSIWVSTLISELESLQAARIRSNRCWLQH